jgi:hypothetical protein
MDHPVVGRETPMQDIGAERPVKRRPKLSRGISNTIAPPPDTAPLNLDNLLNALLEMRSGNFSVRLPAHSPGIGGRIAETFNEICATNENIAQQLEKVGTVVGKEGRTRQRVKFGLSHGAWAEMESSVNTLIDDLLWPTAEVTRAVAAVAQGNLLHTVRLDVDRQHDDQAACRLYIGSDSRRA